MIAFGDENDHSHVDFLNEIFEEPVMVLLRKEIRDKKGIVLINSAILVESNLLATCNNHVILVDADKEIRHERLKTLRNIDPVHAENRIKYMKSHGAKKSFIKKAIETSNFGELVKFENTNASDEDFMSLYETLAKHYK